VALAAYFATETDRFLQPQNLTNILSQNAAVIIVTIGMALTMLVGVLGNGMNLLRVASYQQQMIQGVVLVLAVTLDMFTKRIEQR
jgi:ABC-type xylose transport system permease subunit